MLDSRSSITSEDLLWLAASTALLENASPRLSSGPIDIPGKRMRTPSIQQATDSLRLARSKGMSQREIPSYLKPTKSSQAKSLPPQDSAMNDRVTPSKSGFSGTPLAPSLGPSSSVSSLPATQSKRPAFLSRTASSASVPSEASSSQVPPSPSKRTEWINRKPKAASVSSTISARSPIAGTCSDRRNAGPSNDSTTSIGSLIRTPPTSYSWSPQHRRKQSGSPDSSPLKSTFREALWADQDSNSSAPPSPLLPPPRLWRAAYDSTPPSPTSSRPHSPSLQSYAASTASVSIESIYEDGTPRSILASRSPRGQPAGIGFGRQRSGSCSTSLKSVKFAEAPSVRYASLGDEWVTPDEVDEMSDAGSEDDNYGTSEDGSEMVHRPLRAIGSLLSLREEDDEDASEEAVIHATLSPSIFRRSTSPKFRQEHSTSFAVRLRAKRRRPSVSSLREPFGPSPPAPPFMMPQPAKRSAISLRSAPSCDNFSVKSSSRASMMSVRSMKSVRDAVHGFRNWVVGRRVTV
ncbi:hypothetical protein CYLTODRAFT_290839 [Cylindrobasidium torrendii FP15055 ss-10]|uniref:Uncharacterized protein n=1 Tax=Cylindrobasidium torrendii FP15055 ss-10 TaxID=1314674 RepID=A0A0D7BAF5_9AGAR|nr:hypothetical protein CYLTODRAFT_290839 [Cylindrobasidium torrendii FP15055 ss-10]